MGKRPKRKVVLVLVEGKSDRMALELAITELYEKHDQNIEVFFPIIREGEQDVGGDITSDRNVWPRNIEKTIYNRFLKDFFDEMKLFPKDISEVIHIIDMDGAYIDDQNIIEGDKRIVYKSDHIETNRRDAIIKRNMHKRENIDYLLSIDKIAIKQKAVPYAAYYFSVNLDHVLHNSPNLDKREKVYLADIFSRNYAGNVNSFIDFFMADPIIPNTATYDSSWEYIKKGTNSLKRATNINVLLAELIEK